MAALLTVAACRRHPPGEVVPIDRSPARVEAVNLYAVPVEVLAAGNGTVARLGRVDPGMRSGFAIPQGIIGQGSVEIRVHPTVSGPVWRSGPLLLYPGAIVDLTVTAHFSNSLAVIRPD